MTYKQYYSINRPKYLGTRIVNYSFTNADTWIANSNYLTIDEHLKIQYKKLIQTYDKIGKLLYGENNE